MTQLWSDNLIAMRQLARSWPQPDQLYRALPINARGELISVSVPTLRDWQERLRGVTLAGQTILDFNVLDDGAPQSILAARITPEATFLSSRKAASVDPALTMRAE